LFIQLLTHIDVKRITISFPLTLQSLITACLLFKWHFSSGQSKQIINCFVVVKICYHIVMWTLVSTTSEGGEGLRTIR